MSRRARMGRSSLGIGMDLVEDTEDGRYSSASHAPEPSPQRSPSPFHLHLSAVPSSTHNLVLALKFSTSNPARIHSLARVISSRL